MFILSLKCLLNTNISSFIGVAVRIAQILGLNRDPSGFPEIPRVSAEVRRRVWWYLFYLDIQVSLAAGLPPLIENTSWDVRPISELKDHHIGTPEANEYEEALTSGLDVPISMQQGQIDAASMISTSGLYVGGKYRDASEWSSLEGHDTCLTSSQCARSSSWSNCSSKNRRLEATSTKFEPRSSS